jgi:hypothetical protein
MLDPVQLYISGIECRQCRQCRVYRVEYYTEGGAALFAICLFTTAVSLRHVYFYSWLRRRIQDQMFLYMINYPFASAAFSHYCLFRASSPGQITNMFSIRRLLYDEANLRSFVVKVPHWVV